jgi:ABC-type branched-subunit amino acid transport system substrate-binding protein
MNRLVGILFFFVLLQPVSGQLIQKKSKGDTDYTEALQAFKRENYEVAMAKFAPLTRDYSNQERNVYSHYFYASAAHQVNKEKEAWNMLQQLISRYPGWAHMDEVNYLAGLINFKLKNYHRGLQYLHRITSSSFQKDVAGLEQHYLSDISDLGQLKGLQKQFPSDRVLAGLVVNAVGKRPSPSKSDLELANSLRARFKFADTESEENVEEEKLALKLSGKKTDKKHFDIAVLLPFRVDAFDATTRNRSNQYVFDYYQGLLLAQKELRKQKVDVRIHPFDIGNEKSSVTRLTEDQTFLNADVVLGPLYPETSEEAAEFSRAAGVPVVNPLSTDAKLLTKKYPLYFLAHASLGLQARQVAHVAKGIDKSVVAAVYYGESSKDFALADLYKSEVEAAGGEVVLMKKIGATPETIAPAMTPPAGMQKVSHVVLFSTDPRSGRAFLNQMRAAGYERTPLIATATSFDRYNTDFSIYGRDLYLLDTDYIDYERTETKVFQHDYYQANNTLPSVYSYQGFDQLLFLGRKLAKFKSQVGEGLTQTTLSDRQGYFLGGFDFRDARENGVFSIRKYQGGTWVLAN